MRVSGRLPLTLVTGPRTPDPGYLLPTQGGQRTPLPPIVPLRVTGLPASQWGQGYRRCGRARPLRSLPSASFQQVEKTTELPTSGALVFMPQA